MSRRVNHRRKASGGLQHLEIRGDAGRIGRSSSGARRTGARWAEADGGDEGPIRPRPARRRSAPSRAALTNRTRAPFAERGRGANAGSAVTCTPAACEGRIRMSAAPVSSGRSAAADRGSPSWGSTRTRASSSPPAPRAPGWPTRRSPPAENAIRCPPGDQAARLRERVYGPRTPSHVGGRSTRAARPGAVSGRGPGGDPSSNSGRQAAAVRSVRVGDVQVCRATRAGRGGASRRPTATTPDRKRLEGRGGRASAGRRRPTCDLDLANASVPRKGGTDVAG